MKLFYADLIRMAKILEMGDPLWFDEHGVPRYCDFNPMRSANIYASEIALALVTCQNCGKGFHVCFSFSEADQLLHEVKPLTVHIRERTLHYGDPPNMECCPIGNTMNSEPRSVLQFWKLKKPEYTWVRCPEYEIDIRPDWVATGDRDHE